LVVEQFNALFDLFNANGGLLAASALLVPADADEVGVGGAVAVGVVADDHAGCAVAAVERTF